ncbi:MAG: hypothetical protein KF773_35375 [Deltaproteobacteria bacterium]|nr:hypothetical protein [Deltaproteobacteria bacterium]MCW5809053.1 hypothetical protein [Deltaproteobacteria bacterium]
MTHLRSCALLVAAVAGLGAGGCGLISSDVTDFNLDLPDKMFSVDSTGWQIDDGQAQQFLGTSCSAQPTVCMSAASAACNNCSGECNAGSQKCDLRLDVSLHQAVNLLTEKPELQAINDKPVISVTVDSVTFEVTMNTLNVDTPQMNVMVAPVSVIDPSDPQAKLIGSVAPIPAGALTDGPRSLAFTPTGKADLVATMSSFKVPFNLLIGASLLVREGTPVPSGRLDATIHVKAHAGI